VVAQAFEEELGIAPAVRPFLLVCWDERVAGFWQGPVVISVGLLSYPAILARRRDRCRTHMYTVCGAAYGSTGQLTTAARGVI
jgi:hypothetical protein